MRTYIVEPPHKGPIVKKIEVYDWTVVRGPITCGSRVTHSLVNIDGNISFNENQGPGIPTLSDAMKCLVYMSDGIIARGLTSSVDALLNQLGQEWPDPT